MKKNYLKNMLIKLTVMGLISITCLTLGTVKAFAHELHDYDTEIGYLSDELDLNRVGETIITDTMKSELSNKTVIIDYAHRDTNNKAVDKGANALYHNTRIYESDIANDVSFKVKKILEENGVNVIETRDISGFCSLSDRVELANNSSHDLYISLHLNSNEGVPANGVECFSNNKQGLSCKLVNTISNKYELNSRGSKYDKYYTRKIENSLLLELGFINNVSDMDKILNNEDNLAVDIAEAIIKDLLDLY